MTGGTIDVSDYKAGKRGGRVKVRSVIEKIDKDTLEIKELPYGITTANLMDSIVKANDKGKIKIKKVTDNTAKDVSIIVDLAAGVSPEVTMDALYAFTNCEVSIAPNACVIVDDKPLFLSVNDLLKFSTEATKDLLRQELEIRKGELEEKWHFASLEKIFIENRVYREIEECETWEEVIETIDRELKKYIATPIDKAKKSDKRLRLFRDITKEDIARLTEIRIKRISKYNAFKADELIAKIEEELKQVKHDLANLIKYTISYFEKLLAKYRKGKERKTKIESFETIKVAMVVANNSKLYVNRKEGFIGSGSSMKKEEFIGECSDIDDIIVFLKTGKYVITKIQEKLFVDKNIIHCAVFRKSNERMIYNAIYTDGKTGKTYAKRFAVTSMTRDKEYDLTNGSKGSKVLYFSANPNGEAEVVTINLRAVGSVKKLKWDIDFADLGVKGRGVRGNTITKYAIKSIDFKEAGVSTLKPRKIWFDDAVQRLNVDERGELLGEFKAEDKLLIITQSGKAKAVKPDLAMHFDDDMIVLEKWKPNKPISAIYFDGEKERYYVKRFLIETPEKEEEFISDHPKSQLEIVATDYRPIAEVQFSKRSLDNETVNFEEFIAVKGIKALGNQLTTDKIKNVNLLDSLPFEEPEEEKVENVEVIEEEVIEEKLPIDVPTIEKSSTLDLQDKEDKKKALLKKAIQKKKKESTGDDTQQKLF